MASVKATVLNSEPRRSVSSSRDGESDSHAAGCLSIQSASHTHDVAEPYETA